MTFNEKFDEIMENYLSDYSKHSTAGNPNTSDNPQPTTGNGNADTSDLVSSLLKRAAESSDGLDGVDELDEYINSLGLDRHKLSPLLGELSKRINSNETTF